MRSLLPVLLVIGLAAGPALAETPPHVAVTGTGVVTAAPDLAELVLGVVSEAPTAAQAMKQNSQTASNLLEVLRRRGIATRDFQTSQLALAPRYRHMGGKAALAGFQATHQLHVTVRDLANLGTLLDELVNAGANTVHSVGLAVDKPARLLEQARLAAMADARTRAELYARAAGAKLGEVLAVQETDVSSPVRPVMQLRQAAEAGVPFAPGETKLSVQLNVTWRLR
jgi:uncharacterized protein YggE